MNFVYDLFKSVIIKNISHHMLQCMTVYIALSLVYTVFLCQILSWCIFSHCSMEGGREREGYVQVVIVVFNFN